MQEGQVEIARRAVQAGVDQVGFHGEILPGNRGAPTDVGYGGMGLMSECGLGHIDPGSRDQLVARAQVQGGKQGFSSQTSPGHDLPFQAEKPPEQAVGAADAPGTDQLANSRAAHPGPADYHLRADADLKAEFPAKLLKQRDVAGTTVSEREIAPDENLPRPEYPHHDLPHELLTGHSGQGPVEVQNGKHLQPAGAQQPDLFLGGSDCPGGVVRRQQLQGVGLEAEQDRPGSRGPGSIDQGVQNALVTQVETVEIANGQRTSAVCPIGSVAVGNLHEVNEGGKGEGRGCTNGAPLKSSGTYQPASTGLLNTPMPSISTSTTSPGLSQSVAPGVPVNIRSPGLRVR